MFTKKDAMKTDITRAKSISELLEGMALGKPDHPLIAIVDTAKLAIGEDWVGQRFTSDLYCIALKDSSCGMEYGRNHYDFNEGVLIFTAPDQIMTVTKRQELGEIQGWMLYFHPDLIRNTALGGKIDNYSFFNYEVHEALHLSEKEQETLTNIQLRIADEIQQRIDAHSQSVLVSNLDLMLHYCLRFYERQFHTRAAQHSDVVSKVESLLKQYYSENNLLKSGQPSIAYLAEECHLSPSYLSDVLNKATGRSAKDHINDFIIHKAKHLLVSSQDSISGIAYALGFNYPHYFGRLFKTKTGMTPQEYRNN